MKGKKRKRKDFSDDDDKNPEGAQLKLKVKDIKKRDIIDILRDDENVQIFHEKENFRYFHLAKEIETVGQLIRDRNHYENENKRLVYKYLIEL
jgi:hypothetical protein